MLTRRGCAAAGCRSPRPSASDSEELLDSLVGDVQQRCGVSPGQAGPALDQPGECAHGQLGGSALFCLGLVAGVAGFGDEGVYFLVAGVELIVKGQLALGAVGQVFDEGDDLADVAVEGTQAACIGVGTGQLGNDGEPVVAFSGDHHVVGLHLSHPFPSAGSKSFSMPRTVPGAMSRPVCCGTTVCTE